MPFSQCPSGPPPQIQQTSSLESSNSKTSWRHPYTEMMMTPQNSDSSDGSVTYQLPIIDDRSDRSHTCRSPAHKSIHSGSTTERSDASSSQQTTSTWPTKSPNRLEENTGAFKPIALMWIFLTLAIFLIIIVCLTQASWLQEADSEQSLGLLFICKFDKIEHTFGCNYYKKSFSLSNIPSDSWKMTLITYMVSESLLGLSMLLAVLCLIPKFKARKTISLVAGYMQLFAAILLITALLVFPVGFDSPVVREICGPNVAAFNSGNCQVGWSFALLVTASAFCCLLPVISHYIDHPLCWSHEEEPQPRLIP